MEFIKFIFDSFWTFVGFFALGLLAYAIINAVFNFIVELVHGKQPENKFYLDKETSVELVNKKNKKRKKSRHGSKIGCSDVNC